MTESSRKHVAEQAWTCSPIGIASRLIEVDSAAWLLPFLRLAGGEGEVAGGRLLADQSHRPRQAGNGRTLLEEVELGQRTLYSDDVVRRSFVWRTAGFGVLFRRLEGELWVARRDDGTVLGLEGRYEQPAHLDPVPNGELASRRAAEVAVRSLLGHLRAALEDPAMEEMPA